jgi:hypothetical protein
LSDVGFDADPPEVEGLDEAVLDEVSAGLAVLVELLAAVEPA